MQISKQTRVEEHNQIDNVGNNQQKIQHNLMQDSDFITCPQCCQQILIYELETHSSSCIGAITKCSHCNVQFPRYIQEQHYNVCLARQEQLRRQREEAEQNRVRRAQLNQFRQLIGRLREEEPQISQNYRSRIREQAFQRLLALAQNKNYESDKTGMKPQQLEKLEKINYQQEQCLQLCTICYSHFQEKQEIIKLRCKHLYHIGCIKQWLGDKPWCPVCKKSSKTLL